MKINRRKLYYILGAVILSIFALFIGMDCAFVARGYFAFGGEWLLPFFIAGAAYIIYNRAKIQDKLKEVFAEDDPDVD